MNRRHLSIFMVLAMLVAVLSSVALPANAEAADAVTLTITPNVTEVAARSGSVDVIYTLRIAPQEGEKLGVFGFDLQAPKGMTLAVNSTNARGGDGYWLNKAELMYLDGEYEKGFFEHFTYTPQPNGFFNAAGTTSERRMSAAADIMTIRAVITDASKAGSYALVVVDNEKRVAGLDGLTSLPFVIDSKPVIVKSTSSSNSGGGGGGVPVAPAMTDIEIKAAPDKVNYSEGDKLDLTGLAVTLTYSDGTTKDIAAKDFAKNDITVSPQDGAVLDGGIKEIVIKVEGKTVKQVIVVEKKDDIVTPDTDEPIDELVEEEPGETPVAGSVDNPLGEPLLADVGEHWAQDSIDYLVDIGAIAGYPDGTFKPDAPITRAEFAKVIVDAFELEGTGQVFADTAEHWSKDYVAIAATNEIVSGYNENEFGPDDLITREQMAIIVVKAAGLTAQTGVLSFTDEGEISSWAYDWVVSAVDNNLMSGYADNSFKPLEKATRAEAVTVIYNALMK